MSDTMPPCLQGRPNRNDRIDQITEFAAQHRDLAPQELIKRIAALLNVSESTAYQYLREVRRKWAPKESSNSNATLEKENQ